MPNPLDINCAEAWYHHLINTGQGRVPHLGRAVVRAVTSGSAITRDQGGLHDAEHYEPHVRRTSPVAVAEPGTLSSAYQQFHAYSLGNQLLAMFQCQAKGLQPGPMATFPRWKELGRHVRRGEKALTLCMPLTLKRKQDSDADTDGADGESIAFTRFVYRSRWFVLSQTEGAELPEPGVPEWDAERALATLSIEEVEFTSTDGNVMGYARERSIAINPLNPLPHKTRFHELAHVLLGHTAEGQQSDGEVTPRNLRECEAESIALLCCAALQLPGLAESRGYIQMWWGEGHAIPERSAQAVLRTADAILKAGTAEREVSR